MIHFTKMHGSGNDYVYLDAFETPALEARPDLSQLAVAMSDRHTGVGADGLILVSAPSAEGVVQGAQARMRIFNADGFEGEMCGNGARCVAKLVIERGHVAPEAGAVRIETNAGVRAIQVSLDNGEVRAVTVNMGTPILEPARVGVEVASLEHAGRRGDADEWLINDLFSIFVSMGNPHMVSFITDWPPDSYLESIGPQCEKHPAFPRRINVHLARVLSPTKVRMRTWERGAGLTQACGTGACAVLVAGVVTGRLERDALVRQPGGDLNIRWDARSGDVFMTGPAQEVYTGAWPD